MKLKIIFLISLLVVQLSCTKYDNTLDTFFEKLEKSIDSRKILEFKNSPKDSLYHNFKNIKIEFYKVYDDSIQHSKLNDFFNFVKRDSDKIDYYKIDFLIFAFHSKLNNNNFNYDKILLDTKNAMMKLDDGWNKKEKKLDSENQNLMLTNEKKLIVGNIVSINLPVKFNTEYKTAVYANNYPANLNYSNFNDSLKISGKIVDKNYYINSDFIKPDTSDVRIKLKIISLSNCKYEIFSKKLRVGDTFDLWLIAYGRSITSVSCSPIFTQKLVKK